MYNHRMPNKLDLKNKRIGKLIVLNEVGSGRDGVLWKCRCDCGSIIIKAASKIINYPHCGCTRVKNLIGKRFGKLVVIGLVKHYKKGNGARWKCMCDCSNVKEVSSSNLIQGAVKSCGCNRIRNMVGEKFGRLTVISFSHINNKKQQAHWVCKCSCGNISTPSNSSLQSGHTKSCGCLRTEFTTSKRKKFGEAAFNKVINTYKSNAKTRNIIFSLSKKDMLTLFTKNCYYCDAPPSNISYPQGSYGHFVYNGVDRLDNSRGYTVDNVVPCCKECNRIKNNMHFDYFISWIKRVVKNLDLV